MVCRTLKACSWRGLLFLPRSPSPRARPPRCLQLCNNLLRHRGLCPSLRSTSPTQTAVQWTAKAATGARNTGVAEWYPPSLPLSLPLSLSPSLPLSLSLSLSLPPSLPPSLSAGLLSSVLDSFTVLAIGRVEQVRFVGDRVDMVVQLPVANATSCAFSATHLSVQVDKTLVRADCYSVRIRLSCSRSRHVRGGGFRNAVHHHGQSEGPFAIRRIWWPICGATLPPPRPPFAAPSHTPYAHALHADAAYALSLGRHAAETTALCFVHSSGECRIERVARAVLSVRMNGQRYHSKWGRGNDSNTIIAPIVANQFSVERKAGRTHIILMLTNSPSSCRSSHDTPHSHGLVPARRHHLR